MRAPCATQAGWRGIHRVAHLFEAAEQLTFSGRTGAKRKRRLTSRRIVVVQTHEPTHFGRVGADCHLDLSDF